MAASFKTLVELLGELTPIEVELRREDDLVAVAVLMTGGGRRIPAKVGKVGDHILEEFDGRGRNSLQGDANGR